MSNLHERYFNLHQELEATEKRLEEIETEGRAEIKKLEKAVEDAKSKWRQARSEPLDHIDFIKSQITDVTNQINSLYNKTIAQQQGPQSNG